MSDERENGSEEVIGWDGEKGRRGGRKIEK